METRRDESKRRAITQAFVNRFTLGLGKWKEWLYRLLYALSAWRLLSNIVLAKTNISSTVIMKYILHLISGSRVGHKQTRQLSETYMGTSSLTHIKPQYEYLSVSVWSLHLLIIISASQYTFILVIYWLQKVIRPPDFLHTLLWGECNFK